MPAPTVPGAKKTSFFHHGILSVRLPACSPPYPDGVDVSPEPPFTPATSPFRRLCPASATVCRTLNQFQGTTIHGCGSRTAQGRHEGDEGQILQGKSIVSLERKVLMDSRCTRRQHRLRVARTKPAWQKTRAILFFCLLPKPKQVFRWPGSTTVASDSLLLVDTAPAYPSAKTAH